MSMRTSDLIKLFISIVISLMAGFVGSLFTTPVVPGWYTTLALPVLSPPSWVFGPVWAILYVLMGVAAYLVWKKGLRRPLVRMGLFVFAIQLALNALWSYLFFGTRSPGLAFVEIVFLLVAILATIVLFRRVSTAAAWLLVPYLLWVGFAAYLNYMIWMLN